MYTYQKDTTALQMPSNYVPLAEEEMTYVEGGYRIKESRDFLRKAYCLGYAVDLKKKKGWKNISDFDLAAEIFSHAVAWYSSLTKLGALIGIDVAKSIRASAEVIDVENKPDSRAWAFRIIYTCYPSL